MNTLIQNWRFNGLQFVETDSKSLCNVYCNEFKLLIPLKSFTFLYWKSKMIETQKELISVYFTKKWIFYFWIFACRRQMTKYMLSLEMNHVTLTLWWQPWPMVIFCTRLHLLLLLIMKHFINYHAYMYIFYFWRKMLLLFDGLITMFLFTVMSSFIKEH